MMSTFKELLDVEEAKTGFEKFAQAEHDTLNAEQEKLSRLESQLKKQAESLEDTRELIEKAQVARDEKLENGESFEAEENKLESLQKTEERQMAVVAQLEKVLVPKSRDVVKFEQGRLARAFKMYLQSDAGPKVRIQNQASNVLCDLLELDDQTSKKLQELATHFGIDAIVNTDIFDLDVGFGTAFKDRDDLRTDTGMVMLSKMLESWENSILAAQMQVDAENAAAVREIKAKSKRNQDANN